MFTDLRQLLSGVARMKTIRPVAKIHLVAETRILLSQQTKGRCYITRNTSIRRQAWNLYFKLIFYQGAIPDLIFFETVQGFCFLFSFLLPNRCSSFTIKNTYLALLQKLTEPANL